MTLRSVVETGDTSAEEESLANGDGGARTGTTGSLDGPPRPAEGGGIFTVVGTALVLGGIFTTTGPPVLPATAAGACGSLLRRDAGMVITAAVSVGSGSSRLGEDRLIYSC